MSYVEASAGNNISQQAGDRYLEGKSKLFIGSAKLTTAKQLLNETLVKNNVSITTLKELFEDEFEGRRIPFRDFSDTLYKKYRYEEFNTVITLLKEAETAMVEAKDAFHKASQSQVDFVDAYMGESIAWLKMGCYKEAIESFDKAQRSGFDNLRLFNPLEDDIKYIFYEIAMISGTKTSEVVVIKDLMELRGRYIQNKINKATSTDKEQLENIRMKNKFELAAFYNYCKKKQEAIDEFNSTWKDVKKELVPSSQLYNDLILLKKEIEELVSVRIEVDQDIIDRFEPIIKFKFINKNIACSNDLQIYLLPKNSEIEFMDKGICEYKKSTMDIDNKVVVSRGMYSLQVDFLNMQIIESDKMPCALFLNDKKQFNLLQPEVLFKNIKQEGKIQLECTRYMYEKDGSVIDPASKKKLTFTVGSTIERMIIPEFSFCPQEEKGDYTLRLDKLGDWNIFVDHKINTARSMVTMALLLFMTQ